MSRRMEVRHEFVATIPDRLEEGVLYISIPYATSLHRCLCGCGAEIVTPLSPTDWELSYNGDTISLSPSVGNWSYPCQSHYWIRRNRIQWARRLSEKQIAKIRAQDRLDKQALTTDQRQHPSADPRDQTVPRGWWQRVRQRVLSRDSMKSR